MRLLLLMLLLIWVVDSQAGEIEPFFHGLAHEPPALEASSAMKAFFLNGSVASSSLPEAAAKKNGTRDAVWDLLGRSIPHHDLVGEGGGDERRRRRVALMAIGIASAIAGVGLLVAVLVGAFVLRRRGRREAPPLARCELRRAVEIL